MLEQMKSAFMVLKKNYRNKLKNKIDNNNEHIQW